MSRILTDPDRVWNERVNRVFDTQPRDGASGQSVWLPRQKMENHFTDLLYQDGVHICIDGPSGTGKTSLVKTQLSKEKKKVIPIQLTQHMKWSDLCREIIGDISKSDSNFSADVLLGIRSDLIPQASVKMTYGRKKKGGDNFSRWKSIGSLVNELDLCRALEASGAVLFIDDFEKANDEIVTRISDVCKLMTQSFKGKIVIAGTHDIYYRIMLTEPALESRLLAMTIGALPSADDAWEFLCLGFGVLGIGHPEQLYKRNAITFDQLRECKIAVDDAVGSLPKALNEFGRRVSLTKAGSSRNLSPSDMANAAKKTFYEKINEYGRRFPELQQMLLKKLELRVVLAAIYRRQIGTILYREDIYRECAKEITRDQFEDAVEDLVAAKIITQTGRNREILFVANLYLTHIFGVCANKYEKYELDPQLYGPLGQMSLSLKSG